jgi:hypothetical protein
MLSQAMVDEPAEIETGESAVLFSQQQKQRQRHEIQQRLGSLPGLPTGPRTGRRSQMIAQRNSALPMLPGNPRRTLRHSTLSLSTKNVQKMTITCQSERPDEFLTEHLSRSSRPDSIRDDASSFVSNHGRSDSSVSLGKSDSTLSSLEEIDTPEATGFDFGFNKSVQGPRGPHLFRTSMESLDPTFHLTLSPLTPLTPKLPPPFMSRSDDVKIVPALIQPKVMQEHVEAPKRPTELLPPTRDIPTRPISALSVAILELDKSKVNEWTPTQVAQWMTEAGFDKDMAQKFEKEDVNGAILLQLNYEDLKELDIQSFGKRYKIWNEINILRGTKPAPFKPGGHSRNVSNCTNCTADSEISSATRTTLLYPWTIDANMNPLDPGSIVGVERLLPREHKCSKGENCSKWRKQAKQRALLKADYPVSPGPGGEIVITGFPDVETPTAQDQLLPQNFDLPRPTSVFQPSVVASSDIFTGNDRPQLQLDAEALDKIAVRDPQDNVKQFLDFQHVQFQSEPSTTPLLEMFPPLPSQPPVTSLPPLYPPSTVTPMTQSDVTTIGTIGTALTADSPMNVTKGNFPYHSITPVGFWPPGHYRKNNNHSALTEFRSPSSQLEVPIMIDEGDTPSRAETRSTPPTPTHPVFGHTRSRSLQTPISTGSSSMTGSSVSHQRSISTGTTWKQLTAANAAREQQLFGRRNLEHHFSTVQEVDEQYEEPIERERSDTPSGPQHEGWMKKRNQRWLRHDWQERYFALTGTHLAMHKDAAKLKELEALDVDDYSVAVSSLASSSKFGAAFKNMILAKSGVGSAGRLRGSPGIDQTAFSFQLVPTPPPNNKRGPSPFSSSSSSKPHHFEVKTKDERLDWMRELMIAKAIRRGKNGGYEMNMNGYML